MNALKVEIELPRDLLTALDIPESELGRRTKEWVVLELLDADPQELEQDVAAAEAASKPFKG
jgi:hypothetical protein